MTTPDPFAATPAEVSRWIGDRQRLLRHEAEDALREEILDYGPRQQRAWQRDDSSQDAYTASVAVNRERWAAAVGVLPPVDRPFETQIEAFYEDDGLDICWVTVDFYRSLRARALFARPKGVDRPPVVLAQHGIASSPEKVFGLDDGANVYKAYGRRLVEDGFAVMAPMNVSGAQPRARLTRLCSLLGSTLWSVEIARTQRLLDWLETRDDIDLDRLGMYGISLGGAYTMFTTPLEPRIRCAAACAWFNHRPNKMAVDDPRYTSFLSVDEEHVWIPGWLREFTDSDLASLICPRPFFVEHGKADGIAWWPQVQQEFDAAVEHYRRLGIEDRIGMDLHEGGHEIRLQGTRQFLRRWLAP
jgi:dienelactone hydrolase